MTFVGQNLLLSTKVCMLQTAPHKRQPAVCGKALDHTSIRAGPQLISYPGYGTPYDQIFNIQNIRCNLTENDATWRKRTNLHSSTSFGQIKKNAGWCVFAMLVRFACMLMRSQLGCMFFTNVEYLVIWRSIPGKTQVRTNT